MNVVPVTIVAVKLSELSLVATVPIGPAVIPAVKSEESTVQLMLVGDPALPSVSTA